MRASTTHRRVRMVAGAVLVGAAISAAAVPASAAPARAALQPCQTQTESGSYPPGSADIGIQISQEYAGQGNVVGGGGFAKEGEPGAFGTVQLQVCSTPQSLGTATLKADGTFTVDVTMPANLEPGEHIVQAQGPNGRGGTQTLTTRVTILATPAPAPTNGALPFTGYDLIPLVVAAVLLIATGGGLVVIARRRAQQRTA